MVIKIDETNKIIACYYGEVAKKFPADNVIFFEVEAVPTRKPNETLHFDPEKKTFYTVEIAPEVLAERQAKKEAREKKDTALKWLSDNDWIVNKRVLGEWEETDERWLAYLTGREKARADIDEAEAILKN